MAKLKNSKFHDVSLVECQSFFSSLLSIGILKPYVKTIGSHYKYVNMEIIKVLLSNIYNQVTMFRELCRQPFKILKHDTKFVT